MAKLEELKKQIKHAQKKGLHAELVVLHHAIGEYHARHDDHAEAIDAYIEALRISEAHLPSDLIMQACASRKVGEAYMNVDKLGKALHFIAKYKKLAVRSGDRFEEQRAYTTVGRVLLRIAESSENDSEREQSHLQAAETAFFKSLELCKSLLAELGRTDDANLSTSASETSSRGEKSSGAQKTEKLREVRVMYARALLNLALVFEMRNELERALEFARRSLVVAVRFAFDAEANANVDESETHLYALVNVARIQLALGRYSAASRSAQQLEAAARRRRDRVMLHDALRLRADVALRAEREFSVAFRLLRRAASNGGSESETMLDALKRILHSESILAQRGVGLRSTLNRILGVFSRFSTFEFDPDANPGETSIDAEEAQLCRLTDLDYALSFDWLAEADAELDADGDGLDSTVVSLSAGASRESDAMATAQHFEAVGDALCDLGMYREAVAAYVGALRRRVSMERDYDSSNRSARRLAVANRRKIAALLFSIGQSLRDMQSYAAAAAFFGVQLAFTARHKSECASSWHPVEIRMLIGDTLQEAAKSERAMKAFQITLAEVRNCDESRPKSHDKPNEPAAKRIDAQRFELRLLSRLSSLQRDMRSKAGLTTDDDEDWSMRFESAKRDSGLSEDEIAKLEDSDPEADGGDEIQEAEEPVVQAYNGHLTCVSDSESEPSDGGLSDEEGESKSGGRRRRPRKALWERRNEVGESPLHVAGGHGQLKRVRALIEQGHPVDVRDAAGWTPLHDAAWNGHADCVEALLDAGAPINDCGPANERRSREPGSTALCEALAAGHLHVARLLISRGADVRYTNERGESAIDSMYAFVRNAFADDCCCDSARLVDLRDVERVLIEKYNALATSETQKLRSRIDEVMAEARRENEEESMPREAEADADSDRTVKSHFAKEDDVLANPILAYRDAVQSVGRRHNTRSRNNNDEVGLKRPSVPQPPPKASSSTSTKCFDFGAVSPKRASSGTSNRSVNGQSNRQPFVGLRARGYCGFEDNEEIGLGTKVGPGRGVSNSNGPPAKRPCLAAAPVSREAASRPVATANRVAIPFPDSRAPDLQTRVAELSSSNSDRNRDRPAARRSLDSSSSEMVFDTSNMEDGPSAQSTQQVSVSVSSTPSRCSTDSYSSLQAARNQHVAMVAPTPAHISLSRSSSVSSSPVMQPQGHAMGLSPYLAAQINTLHSIAADVQGQANAAMSRHFMPSYHTALGLGVGVGVSEPQATAVNASSAASASDRVVLRLKVRVRAPIVSSFGRSGPDEAQGAPAPTFMIPVREADATRSFDWLVSEIRTRFFREFGEKAAELKLCTADGCLVSAADRLSDIFPITITPTSPNASGELVAHVIAWDPVPLADRYTQLCAARGLPPHRNFAAYLAKAENTRDGRFAFVELRAIPAAFAQCVAVGLLEHRFRRLEFDSNKLGDVGFDLLVRAIVDQLAVRAQTRPRMAESPATDFCVATFAVRNNQLSCRALRVLDDAFASLSISALEQLDLSGNDLAEACSQNFWTPIASLIGRSQLTHLVFRRCSLTDAAFSCDLAPIVAAARSRSLRFDFCENPCELDAFLRFLASIVAQLDASRSASRVDAVITLTCDEQLAAVQRFAAATSTQTVVVQVENSNNADAANTALKQEHATTRDVTISMKLA